MNVKTIITARTNSSRLNSKILKKIVSNYKAIDVLIYRAEKIGFPIILCTSISKSDDQLVKYVKKKYKKKIMIFRGSLKNKLQRWYDCFIKNKIDYACMIDGDDLSFCFDLYRKSITLLKYNNLDLIQYSNRMIPGSFTYSLSFNCLHKIKHLFKKNKNTEMVDPFFNSKKIKKTKISFPKYLSKKFKVRITMDYEEDLLFFRKLYSFNNIDLRLKDLLIFLKKEKNITKINFFREADWSSNQTKLKEMIKL
jgi:spore coat polysaccharide biosynthesis protein SpsF